MLLSPGNKRGDSFNFYLQRCIARWEPSLKENSIIGSSWSSEKFFIVQDFTENADEDVPLTVKNV